MAHERWPTLPYDAWKDTYATLHMWLRIVGKIAPARAVQFESGLIDKNGHVSNESTRQFVQNVRAEFHAFITRVYTVLPRNASGPASWE